jgi:hypothetical protein
MDALLQVEGHECTCKQVETGGWEPWGVVYGKLWECTILEAVSVLSNSGVDMDEDTLIIDEEEMFEGGLKVEQSVHSKESQRIR